VSKKLLLADDSVTIQKVIELTFADEDIEVIAVSNGSQAISLAPVERPDIVLADVGMPERDGYEVAAFIKRTPGLSHIPVLLLTGAFEPIDEGRAKAAGCDGVLVKPFEPQMVINRVKDLIAGKRPLTTGFQSAPAPEITSRPASTPVPANEYFNRLDAALGTKEPARPAPPTAADLASELANWQPEATIVPPRADAPIAPSTSAPAPISASAGADAAVGKPSTSAPAASTPAPPASAPAPPTSVPTLSEAFAALLAAERGTVAPPAALTEPATREDVVEQVTRRVIERMTDTAVRDTVVEVAERLVREEILRIKNQPK
jgi:CheY-like chemotaxis protein